MAEVSERPGEDDGELVAPQPGHRVLAPDHRPQPLGHLAEKLVAGRMAAAVVDPLETVQVDEEDRGALVRRGGPLDLSSEPFLKGPSVRQPGEHVVPRHPANLLEQPGVLEGGHRLVGQGPELLLEVPVGARVGDPSVEEVGPHDAEELVVREERGEHAVGDAVALEEAA